MPWLSLVIAGCLEVVWAMGLKASEGFSKPGWTALTLVTMLLSFSLLAHALKTLPVGTGYAVWTGIGAVGSALCGIWFFNEANSVLRLFCIGLICLGILGLKFSSPSG